MQHRRGRDRAEGGNEKKKRGRKNRRAAVSLGHATPPPAGQEHNRLPLERVRGRQPLPQAPSLLLPNRRRTRCGAAAGPQPPAHGHVRSASHGHRPSPLTCHMPSALHSPFPLNTSTATPPCSSSPPPLPLPALPPSPPNKPTARHRKRQPPPLAAAAAVAVTYYCSPTGTVRRAGTWIVSRPSLHGGRTGVAAWPSSCRRRATGRPLPTLRVAS